MRKLGLIGFVICVVALAPAFGDTLTFTTSAGAHSTDGPVSGIMTITYAGPNHLLITVNNLLTNPQAQGQIITGLELSTSSGLTGAAITASAGETRDLAGDGSGNFVYSCSGGPGCVGGLANNGSGATGTTVATDWQASSSFFNGGLALCAGGCGTWKPDGIIGSTGASNDTIAHPQGQYTNANSSIYGNSHSPDIYGPVTFTVSASNIDSLTSNGTNLAGLITGANFNFGTSGQQISLTGGCSSSCGPPSDVPEPSSTLLFGSGLCGLVGLLRRKLQR